MRFSSETRTNPHEIKTLQNFLKSTSIKHGNADFEDSSTAKDSFTPLKHPGIIPQRFNQEETALDQFLVFVIFGQDVHHKFQAT